MKNNIMVCCESMMRAIGRGEVHWSWGGPTQGEIFLRSPDQTYVAPFKLCPWCAKKLPFECEEQGE